jgi:hypothetical protein
MKQVSVHLCVCETARGGGLCIDKYGNIQVSRRYFRFHMNRYFCPQLVNSGSSLLNINHNLTLRFQILTIGTMKYAIYQMRHPVFW